METTISNHPKFGIIRGLNFKFETKRIKMMLAGIKTRKVEVPK